MSFAVKGPKLWNAMPYDLNVIQDLEHFKDQLTKFMLSLPDRPPIRGYTPPNSNSLLRAGEMMEKQLRSGVVGFSDGPIKF